MLQCYITPFCNFPENSREDQANQIRHFATACSCVSVVKFPLRVPLPSKGIFSSKESPALRSTEIFGRCPRSAAAFLWVVYGLSRFSIRRLSPRAIASHGLDCRGS